MILLNFPGNKITIKNHHLRLEKATKKFKENASNYRRWELTILKWIIMKSRMLPINHGVLKLQGGPEFVEFRKPRVKALFLRFAIMYWSQSTTTPDANLPFFTTTATTTSKKLSTRNGAWSKKTQSSTPSYPNLLLLIATKTPWAQFLPQRMLNHTLILEHAHHIKHNWLII